MVPSAPTGKKLPLHRPALSVPLHYESFSASEQEPMGRSLVRQTTGGDNREMVQRRQIRFPTPDLSWLLKRKWPLVAGVVLLGTIGGFLSGMRVRLDHRTWLEPSPPATRGGEQALDERDSAVTLGRERAAEERNPAAKSQAQTATRQSQFDRDAAVRFARTHAAAELTPPPEITTESLKEEFAATGRNLIARYPESSDSYALMASIEFNLGRSAAAEKWWRKSLEVNPRFAWAWHGMGNLAAQKGDYEEAVTCFRKATLPGFLDHRSQRFFGRRPDESWPAPRGQRSDREEHPERARGGGELLPARADVPAAPSVRKGQGKLRKGDRDPSRLHARLLRTFGNVQRGWARNKRPSSARKSFRGRGRTTQKRERAARNPPTTRGNGRYLSFASTGPRRRTTSGTGTSARPRSSGANHWP